MHGSDWREEDVTCGSIGQYKTTGHPCQFYENQPGQSTGNINNNLTLDGFIHCDGNLGINRQTRMLANLSALDCKNVLLESHKTLEVSMLQSAKDNLQRLHFFGMTEHQHATQILFERTFNMTFKRDFVRNKTIASVRCKTVTKEQLDLVAKINHLDVQLYRFARKIFFSRLDLSNRR